jgi:Kef-type K+ transport system membrane component KefB
MTFSPGDAAALILVAAGAFLLPMVGTRAAVPAVVLEIIFGILIGPVFGIVEETELLSQLGELGFLLLMFLSGFEIDLRLFERRGIGQIAVAAIVFGLTLIGGYLFAQLLDLGLFLMLILATTSVGLVVPTLRSTRRMGTRMGQAILVSALLADFLTLLGVTILAVIEEQGAGLQLLKVPGFFVFVAAALMLLRWSVWWHPERFRRLFEQDDPEELGIRAALALMLVFVGISMLFSIEPILGAFLAGTVFAIVFRQSSGLETKLKGFSYGFLIPVFFINVGIRFDLEAMRAPGALVLTLQLIGAAFLVKVVPALLLVLRRLTLRESLAAGFLLSARLSLILAVAELGVRLGVIDLTLQAEIILLTAVTTTLAPILFRLIAPPVARQGVGDTRG